MNSGWSVAGGWTVFGLAVAGGATAGWYQYKEKHDIEVELEKGRVIERRVRLTALQKQWKDERTERGKKTEELTSSTNSLVTRLSEKKDVPNISIAFEGAHGGIQARASVAGKKGQETHAQVQRRMTKTNR